MAYDLFVTQAAHEDLEEALGYIAGDLANPSAAANLLDQVEALHVYLWKIRDKNPVLRRGRA